MSESEIIAEKKLDEIDMQLLKSSFAAMAKLIKMDLNANRQNSNFFNTAFRKEDILKWLANPQKFEKRLRDLSWFLYHSSSHYRRLIDYFGTMLTFDHVIDILGQKKVGRKQYEDAVFFLDNMNVKHEFLRLNYLAWIDDVAYGYEYSVDNSYFIDTLDPNYCAISSIEDGCLNYAFDFRYFDKYSEELDRYADEFKKKYEVYRQDKQKKRWQELDSEKTICIKVSQTDYVIPPFAGIFEEIYALYDYKDLQLSKTELENYLLLVAKIPYLSKADKANDFGLSLDIANDYFARMNSALPQNIGSLLSPFDTIDAVKLKTYEKDLDTVSLAESSIYNAAGVPKLVFNSDKASGAALNKAIAFDENTVFKVLRQFERWTNRKLKKDHNFKVNFLDITRNNRDDLVKQYKEASTLGLPVKLRYCAALGLTPADTLNSLTLENGVLNIVEQFKPLETSYTQPGDDVGGRPDQGDNVEGGTEDGDVRDANNPDNRA